MPYRSTEGSMHVGGLKQNRVAYWRRGQDGACADITSADGAGWPSIRLLCAEGSLVLWRGDLLLKEKKKEKAEHFDVDSR